MRSENISVGSEYASGHELGDSTPSIGSFRSCSSQKVEDELLDNLSNPHSEDGDQDGRADMEKLGKEMIAHCGGLPSAIIELVDILKAKSYEWEALHQNFNSYLMGRNLGENGRILEELALSYHDLPYQIKQCFWHLGNFPKGYIIPTSKLYQLWAAEGFLLSAEEMIMETAESCLQELIQRKLVQVQMNAKGRPKSCQLHNFIRDICILKGKAENFVKEIPLSAEPELECATSSSSRTLSSNASRRLSLPVDSLFGMNYASEREHHGHIRSAMFFSMPTERKNLQLLLQSLCDDFKLLRVLHLERFNFGEVLSEAIGKLIHLRYLSFRGSLFHKLPHPSAI